MDNKHSHIDEELLVKHMLGEAGEAEQAEVKDWLQQSEANRAEYERYRTIWEHSKTLAAGSNVNVDDAWGRFQQRVNSNHAGNTVPLAPRRFSPMRVAATLLVLLGCGWLIGSMVMKNYAYTYASTGNETSVTTLPDGSVVTLNKNSGIRYTDFMTGGTRRVTLTGEAFFDVAPDKSKPFIITAGSADIKVVGTSFNVKTGNARTEVIVETGIVEVSKKQNRVKLLPGEKATVSQNNDAPSKDKVDDVLYNYYRTRELVCNNTPLWRLADVLNDAYDVHIVVADDRLKDLPINTTFKNESLDNILLVISETLKVKIERKGKDITIR